MTRTCGTCSACCRWPSVPEINKPPKTSCKNLFKKGYGCKDYANRPKACAEYLCSWIKGLGVEKDQPDKCHIIIDRKFTQFGIVLVAKQLRPGAAFTGRGKGAISRAAKDAGMLCLITDYDHISKVIGVAGPKELTDRFREENGNKPTQLGGGTDFANNLIRQIGEGSWQGM